MIKDIEYLNVNDIDSYMNFIKEIFGYECNKETIEKMIENSKVLVIKKDEEVVASISLEERFEYIKNQKYYVISYMGVKKEYRRRGYASSLFDKVEELVRENDIRYIELTSGNQRRQAHYFYKDKQFKIKDTMVFVKFY